MQTKEDGPYLLTRCLSLYNVNNNLILVRGVLLHHAVLAGRARVPAQRRTLEDKFDPLAGQTVPVAIRVESLGEGSGLQEVP